MPEQAVAPLVGPNPETEVYHNALDNIRRCRIRATDEDYEKGNVVINWGTIGGFIRSDGNENFRGDESRFDDPEEDLFTIPGTQGRGFVNPEDGPGAFAVWQCVDGATSDTDLGIILTTTPPAIDGDRRDNRQDAINLITLVEPWACEHQPLPGTAQGFEVG